MNPAADCGLSSDSLLTGEGIGELRIGRTVAAVGSRCQIESDAMQPGPEGSSERALLVRLGPESVRSVIVDDRVWRIEISTERFRTADSLGVDSPLSRIARTEGAQFAPGEGGVYGFVPQHCGLSFRFSLPLMGPRGHWTPRTIDEAHRDAAVDRVLVTSCRR